MKKFFLFAALAAFCLTAGAQSALDLKIGPLLDKHDYAKAEEILNTELAKANEKWEKKKIKDPAAQPDTKKLAEVYNKLGDVYGMQFNKELLNAAQSLPLDTMKYIQMLDKTVECYTNSYVNDVAPDEKGKVKAKFVANNKKQLFGMVDYYYYGGIFMHNNHDMPAACREFKKFINYRKNPAFTAAEQDSIYKAKKADYDQAALNVALIYYQNKDWDNLLANVDEAMGDPKNMRDAYIMKMNAYLEKKDTASWVNCLEEAVTRVEDNTNFIEQLVGYYTTKKDAVSANAYVDKLLAANPNNKTALYMKGCIKMNIEEKYEESREYFGMVLAQDADDVNSNVNMAVSYVQDIREKVLGGHYKYYTGTSRTITNKNGTAAYNKEIAAYQKEKAEVQEYYQKAKTYAEHVRELKPDNVRLWGPALSIIYSNLEMRKEAKEVDDIISAFYKK